MPPKSLLGKKSLAKKFSSFSDFNLYSVLESKEQEDRKAYQRKAHQSIDHLWSAFNLVGSGGYDAQKARSYLYLLLSAVFTNQNNNYLALYIDTVIYSKSLSNKFNRSKHV